MAFYKERFAFCHCWFRHNNREYSSAHFDVFTFNKEDFRHCWCFHQQYKGPGRIINCGQKHPMKMPARLLFKLIQRQRILSDFAGENTSKGVKKIPHSTDRISPF